MKRLPALLSLIALGAAGAEPDRTEFGYEAPLVIEQPGSIYRVPLSADVYRAVTRADLGDMRVYNAAGEIVPHGVTRRDLEPTKATAALPIFAVPLEAARSGASTALHVQVNESGAIVDIKTTGRPKRGRYGYLVDASQTKEPLEAIELELAHTAPGGFLGTLRVERSDNLNDWQTVTEGAIATLKHGQHLLEQKRVALPRQRFKYLRIAWTDSSLTQSIAGVTAELRAAAEPPRDWSRFEGSHEDQAREYRYTSDLQAPIDRARIVLEKNSVARVAVYARAKSGDPWTPRGEKTVYFLQTDAGEVRDNEIRLNYSGAAPQWLVRLVGQPHGAAAAPVLELGWVPHELIFVARGDGPFALAYGRAATGTIDFGVEELLRRAERAGGERVEVRAATLGTPVPVRGEAARSTPWYRGDWKQWVLWTVLVLGVGLLAYFALRLGRQMGRDPTQQ